MNPHSPFEEELADVLRRIADTAPPPPHPGCPERRLRRQAIRRWGLGFLAVVAVLGTGSHWFGRTPPDPTPVATPAEGLGEKIASYLVARGAEAAELEKRPGESVSITLRGPSGVDMQTWAAELDALVAGHAHVRLSLLEGRIRYFGAVRAD